MAVMRRLNLDYQKFPDQPRRAAGWALLMTGVALLAEMTISYGRLHTEREAMNGEIRTSKLRLDAPRTHTNRQFTDKDLDAARQIVNRLSTPWDALFAGLESVKNKNIAILSMDPDMQTGLLRISGEGKDFASVLTLVAQLRTRKAFSEVFLRQHEIKRDDPQHPINFTLSLRWAKPS